MEATTTHSVMDYLQQEDIKTTITNVDNDEELSSDTYEEEASRTWYSIAILVLAIIGLAINLTAVIIMRKKRGIFHTMLKVKSNVVFYRYLPYAYKYCKNR